MKKILALLVCVVMLFSAVALVACNKADKETELLLWAASGDQSFMRKHADAWAKQYNEANGTNYTVAVGIMGEGDAGTSVITSVKDAADVFMFADDQLERLVDNGAIASLGKGADAQKIIDANTELSVNAATYNEELYAYPATADNGYVLFYNNKKLTADDVKNWDTLMTKAQELEKKVHYNFDNAWYSASSFFTFGGTVSVSETNFASIGTEVAKQLFNLKTGYGKDTLFNDDTNTYVPGGLEDGSMIAAVAGAYLYGDLKDLSNAADISVAVLPAFTPIDTDNFGPDDLQMKSFSGCKLCGVNAQGKFLAESHSLAAYLTSEAVQNDRLVERGTGPSNKVVAARDDLATYNPAIAQLKAMIDAGNTVPQINLPAGFWDALPTFTKGIFAAPVLVDGALVPAELTKLNEALVTGFKLAD